MTLISIIIPTFNSEKTIEICLDSVIKQNFKSYEIIIQDGQSSDSTVPVIQRLKNKNPTVTIRIFSEKDKGVYDAMNKGIARAKGDYIYFLGSDDYLFDNDVLQNVSAFIGRYDGTPHMLYGNVQATHLGQKYDGAFTLTKLMQKNICHQSIFYSRQLCDILGGYRLKYKALSDWEYNLRCFLHPKVSTQYMDVMVAYYAEGGLSMIQEDLKFFKYKNSLVASNGYLSLPLKELKFYCSSNREFLWLMLRRIAYNLLHFRLK